MNNRTMITSYEELPIGKFNKVVSLVNEEGGTDASVSIISVLSDIPEEDLLHLPLEEYRKLRDEAAFLFFEPKFREVQKSYRCGGFTLVPTLDFRKITTAQYIDYNEYLKAGAGNLDIQVLSVILVPEGYHYNEGYDIIEVQEAIENNLCCLDVSALRGFFTTRLEKLMLDSLTSSERIVKKLSNKEERKILKKQIKEAKRSLRSGAGSGRWMLLPSSHAVLGPKYML